MKIYKFLIVLIVSLSLIFILNTFEEPDIIEDEFSFSNEYNRLFDDSIKHHITIEISNDEFLGMSEDMLEYASIDERMRTGNYRKASITYEDEYGQIINETIGIRTKGNTSRLLPYLDGEYQRSHFKLKFNETFDTPEGTDAYNTLNNQSMFGVKELILKSNMEFDPSYVHELFGYEMQKELGLIAPEVTLTTLTFMIDGKEIDYGVYSVIESIDKEFLTRNFSKAYDDGNLYKCLWQDYGPATLSPVHNAYQIGIKDWERSFRPTYDLKTNKDEQNHNELLLFIDQINTLDGDEYIDYLNTHFEVERYLKSTILNVLMGMPDDYWAMGNNYYLYFNPNGKIEFIQTDYDNSLGSGWDGWGYGGIQSSSAYYWYDLVNEFTGENTVRPLIEKMLDQEAYRELYGIYLNEIYDEFTYDKFLSYYDWANELYGEDTLKEHPFTLTSEAFYFERRRNAIKFDLKR